MSCFLFLVLDRKPKWLRKVNLAAPFAALAVAMNSDSNDNIFPYFFIPLFPMSKQKNTTVKCLHCGTVMPSMVLHHAQARSEIEG